MTGCISSSSLPLRSSSASREERQRAVGYRRESAGGHAPLDNSLRRLSRDLAPESPIATLQLVERIEAMGFEWGVSDGN